MLIHKYEKSWIKDFEKIKKVISEALVNLKISVEHIGSTSIPELAAKPIIDIDVIFDEASEFDELKRRLDEIGYYYNGNQGVFNREVFKRHKTPNKHDVLDFIAHHLYVCPTNSEELQRHILFRNYLIANEDAKIQYRDLKYRIAEEAGQNQKKYAELKEVRARTFVNAIIAKAA